MTRIFVVVLFCIVALCFAQNCPTPCNYGYCNTNTTSCVCNQGYGGVDCSLKLCPNDCSGNGGCNSTMGICTCFKPFSGIDCSLLCPGNCTGHGVCNNGICSCERRYFGIDCSDIRCLDMTCNNRGACDIRKGTCFCNSGSFGPTCEYIFCPMNCTGRGDCNVKSGICTCSSDWQGDACTINVHVKELEMINYVCRFIGTTFVVVVAALLVFMAFTTYSFGHLGLFGHILCLIEFIQFIGIIGFAGSKNLDPLFVKFSYSFSWANFIFNLGLISAPTELERGPIFFLDNFFIVCIFVLLCGIFSSSFAVYRNYRGQANQILGSLILLTVRGLVICYNGLSISVTYEISLAFQGKITVIAFLGAICIFFGYILLFPIGSYLYLKDGASISTHRSFAPLFSDFKEKLYLFGVFTLFKKFLFGVLVGFFQSNNQDQMIGIILLLVCYGGLIIITRPFVDDLKNWAEIAAVSVQILNVVFELLMWVWPRGISIGLIMLNIVTILGLTAVVIYRIIKRNPFEKTEVKEKESPADEEQGSQDALLNEKERLNEIRDLNDDEETHDLGNEKLLDQSINSGDSSDIDLSNVKN